jgi:hypothetical protein
VDLLHVQEQPVEVAHRLAHGAHVLLLRVQGAAAAGRVQPRQHPAPLPRPDHQLGRRLPAPNRRNMPTAHVLEEGLAVGKSQQAEAALKPAPNNVRGASRKLQETFLHRRSPIHQPVFGLYQGKLGSHAHLRRLRKMALLFTARIYSLPFRRPRCLVRDKPVELDAAQGEQVPAAALFPLPVAARLFRPLRFQRHNPLVDFPQDYRLQQGLAQPDVGLVSRGGGGSGAAAGLKRFGPPAPEGGVRVHVREQFGGVGMLGGGIAVSEMQGADSELGLKENLFYAKNYWYWRYSTHTRYGIVLSLPSQGTVRTYQVDIQKGDDFVKENEQIRYL